MRAQPTRELLKAIINKASKCQGSNILHNAQDAAEMERCEREGENVTVPLQEGFGEGEMEENASKDENEEEMVSVRDSEEEDNAPEMLEH